MAINVQVGLVSFGSEVCGGNALILFLKLHFLMKIKYLPSDGSVPAVYARIEDPQIRDWIRQISNV